MCEIKASQRAKFCFSFYTTCHDNFMSKYLQRRVKTWTCKVLPEHRAVLKSSTVGVVHLEIDKLRRKYRCFDTIWQQKKNETRKILARWIVEL